MIPPDDQIGAHEEALSLETELRRNRRRTLRLLSGAVGIGALWAVYSQFWEMQPAAPTLPVGILAAAASLAPRPAAPHAKHKVVYPYSVIPGGVYSATELSQALAEDPVAAAHYSGFGLSDVRPVAAPRGTRLYASYRIGTAVYWSEKPVTLHENETLLTDGVHLARARCGNRLSDTPRTPVGPRVELDSVEADEADAQWREPDPEGRGVPPAAAYPRFKLVHEIFPDVLLEGNRRLTAVAAAAVAQLTPRNVASEESDTLSGYADPKRTQQIGAPISEGRWLPGGNIVDIRPTANRSGQLPAVPSLAGPAIASEFTSLGPPELVPWRAIPVAAAASESERAPIHSESWTPLGPFPAQNGPAPLNVPPPIYSGSVPFDPLIPGSTIWGGGSYTGIIGGGGGSTVVIVFENTPETPPAAPEPGVSVLAALGLTILALRRAARKIAP